ncbi:MAG TPA: hypothetical protein VK860_05915 [Ilumatobacteraceae bacterium]|nr:hypothetical protein [Ilumatobacteraceae bacterium]
MDTTSFPPPRPPWPAPVARVAPAPPESARRGPRLSAAGWLATAGASLLLVASVIVVAGNWESIDPVVRFSGLVAALFAVYFAAEAGRCRFPTTSTSLATLAACLTAPVGVAAAATLGQPWSVCTLVGGVAALAATEVQSRRWSVASLKAATVAAFGLAAVGLSAVSGIPAPVIVAAGAAGALLLGSTRRASTLAIAVGASPLLVALADAGIGVGTLDRIGVTGDELVWSAPLSSAIAAAVLAVVAQRARNVPLAVTSVAVFGSGVLTSLVSGGFGPVVWFGLPAVVVLAAESAGAMRSDSIWRRIGRSAVPVSGGLTVAALASPLVALVARWDMPANVVAEGRWYVPLAFWTAALTASSAGSARREGGVWVSVPPLAASAASFAALAMAGAPMWSLAVAALVGWIAVTLVTPWSSWDAVTAVSAAWVLAASLVDEGTSTFWVVALVVAGAITVVSCSVVGRSDAGFRAIAAAALAAVGASAVVTASNSSANAAFQVGSLVFVGLVGIAAAIRPERSTWPLGIAGYVALRAITDRPDFDWFAPAVAALLAGALAGSSRSTADVRAHLAAAVAVVAGGFGFAAAGVDPGTTAIAVSLAGIGLSGLASLDRRLAVGRTAGVTASSVAVVAALAASPVVTSIAVAVLGAQLATVGVATHRRELGTPGAALTAGAIASLWWTTGTNQWAIEAIAPYGADGGDVAITAASAALLVAGWLLRRQLSASTWLAYSPGLGMAGTWLIATQLEVGTDWATFGALLFGVVAMAIGGVRRLGAPLVLGTLTAITTIVVSAGSRLATTPTWVWIAVGGAGLLVIAALIERSERPLLPVGRRGGQQRSLLEQFCDEFQ